MFHEVGSEADADTAIPFTLSGRRGGYVVHNMTDREVITTVLPSCYLLVVI